jgi:hypothetical protein
MKVFVVLIVLCACPRVADAHRLDEYLQATRVAIEVDRVGLEIDLTPGVSVATTVLSWLDTNGDGRISTAEGDAYARQVLGAVGLSVDGRRAEVALVDSRFPDVLEMADGSGVIRIRGAAHVRSTGFRRHQLAYFNGNHPEMSVYLVNTLVPADPRIQVRAQHRDPAQHGLRVDYEVTAGRAWLRATWLIITIGVLFAGRRWRVNPLSLIVNR